MMKTRSLLHSMPWRLSAWLLPIVLVAGLAAPTVAQVQEPSLAIDVSPVDNEPAKPGEIESCIEVQSGDEFEVDVMIEDVEELLAWEIYVEYDQEILEIIALDVKLFQAANPGSAVFDVSEALPDNDGMIRLAATDTSDPPTPDSGSGTLARLKLRALTAGESPVDFVRSDIDDNGRLDFAPFLRDVSLNILGDSDGDTFFDGPAEGAKVAVETSCPPGPGSVTAPGDDRSGSNTWVFIAAGAGMLAIATVAAGILFFRRRGSSPMRPTPRA